MSKLSMIRFFVAVAAALSFTSANAIPVTFSILHGEDGGIYSLIHDNSTPSGGNWQYVDASQTFSGWLDESSLYADPDQLVALSNGETLTIHSFDLELDGEYGIRDTESQIGSLVYSLTNAGSTISGIFGFTGLHYSSIFNRASMDDGIFTAYVWGGDTGNQLGIDLGVRSVPEPATLFLLGLGLLGLTFSRRRPGRTI